MFNKTFRLVLVSVIAVQAFVIFDYGQQQELASANPESEKVEVIQAMLEEMESMKAVLSIKEKLVTELESKLNRSIEENDSLRVALANANDEIQAYSSQMLVSYGTIAETGKLLADIAGNVTDGGVSSDDLSALFAVMQEVEYLYESPDDFAVFHANFLEHVMGLSRRTTSKIYQKLLQYSDQALVSGLVPSYRPEERAEAIAWDVRRSLLNDQATLAIMEELSDEELIVFERFYQQGILDSPDFGIKPIGSPIVLSKEDVIDSGGQIFMVDESKIPVDVEE